MLRSIGFALLAVPLTSRAVVTFEGLEGAPLENARQFATGEPGCNAGRAEVRRYADSLESDLLPALEAYGYYEPSISAKVEPRTEDCWQVVVKVDPGMPVAVDHVTLRLAGDGHDDAALRALLDAFPLERGSPLRHDLYQAFKSQLEARAAERGYLDGRFATERIDVYVKRDQADVTLVYDTGPRYAFGPVTFDTGALTQGVLDSFLPFKAGDPYDAAKIADLQRELVASRYFARAEVAPQLDNAHDREIPIHVALTPAKPTSYSIGGGYSTDDGPRFSFSYDNARRNSAGHQISADLLIAAVRQNASLEYRVPRGNPERDWLSYRVGFARESVEAGVGAAARAGAQRTHVGTAFTSTKFLDGLYERDEIAGERLDTRLLIPGMSWARSQRDDFARPREGYRTSFDVSLGIGATSLVQSNVRVKWITATRWAARVIVRGQAGVTFEDGPFDQVPLSLRYFAGGDNSVRGYDYRTLGPRNAAGELIGGDRLLVGSVEYEHPVRKNWSVAVFADAGNAFLGSSSSVDARVGAGIGARWFSPIGPIRVDVAWPVNAPAGDRSPRLHISLGPDI
jgi:translocation and assembly module TamA